MKLYVISGLGADRSVFDRIDFPAHLEVVFIDWLIPEFGRVSRIMWIECAKTLMQMRNFIFWGILLAELSPKKFTRRLQQKK